jgi:hypothetical protein
MMLHKSMIVIERKAAQAKKHSSRVNIFVLAGHAIAAQSYLLDDVVQNDGPLVRAQVRPRHLVQKLMSKQTVRKP